MTRPWIWLAEEQVTGRGPGGSEGPEAEKGGRGPAIVFLSLGLARASCLSAAT